MISTKPYGVPKEMVEIGTPWSFAVRAAVKAPFGLSGLVGTVSLPSENSTTRAGGGASPPPITAPTVAIACSAVKMPSPVAVRSANCSLSSAALVAARLVVGDTNTVAVPA